LATSPFLTVLGLPTTDNLIRQVTGRYSVLNLNTRPKPILAVFLPSRLIMVPVVLVPSTISRPRDMVALVILMLASAAGTPSVAIRAVETRSAVVFITDSPNRIDTTRCNPLQRLSAQGCDAQTLTKSCRRSSNINDCELLLPGTI
jgi:hypothetical protein